MPDGAEKVSNLVSYVHDGPTKKKQEKDDSPKNRLLKNFNTSSITITGKLIQNTAFHSTKFKGVITKSF